MLRLLLILFIGTAQAQTPVLDQSMSKFKACAAHHHPEIVKGILTVTYDTGWEHCKADEKQFADDNCQHVKVLKGPTTKFKCAGEKP